MAVPRAREELTNDVRRLQKPRPSATWCTGLSTSRCDRSSGRTGSTRHCSGSSRTTAAVASQNRSSRRGSPIPAGPRPRMPGRLGTFLTEWFDTAYPTDGDPQPPPVDRPRAGRRRLLRHPRTLPGVLRLRRVPRDVRTGVIRHRLSQCHQAAKHTPRVYPLGIRRLSGRVHPFRCLPPHRSSEDLSPDRGSLDGHSRRSDACLQQPGSVVAIRTVAASKSTADRTRRKPHRSAWRQFARSQLDVVNLEDDSV